MSVRKRGNAEGSIFQLPGGRWRATISLGFGPDGKRRRRVIEAFTRREVQKRLTKILRDQHLGFNIAPERLTVGRFLDRWLTDVVKTTVRPKTYRSYSDIVKLHIIPALGSYALGKLEPDMFRPS